MVGPRIYSQGVGTKVAQNKHSSRITCYLDHPLDIVQLVIPQLDTHQCRQGDSEGDLPNDTGYCLSCDTGYARPGAIGLTRLSMSDIWAGGVETGVTAPLVLHLLGHNVDVCRQSNWDNPWKLQLGKLTCIKTSKSFTSNFKVIILLGIKTH